MYMSLYCTLKIKNTFPSRSYAHSFPSLIFIPVLLPISFPFCFHIQFKPAPTFTPFPLPFIPVPLPHPLLFLSHINSLSALTIIPLHSTPRPLHIPPFPLHIHSLPSPTLIPFPLPYSFLTPHSFPSRSHIHSLPTPHSLPSPFTLAPFPLHIHSLPSPALIPFPLLFFSHSTFTPYSLPFTPLPPYLAGSTS